MPELPEVETVVRGLQATIVGETIQDIETPWSKALQPDSAYDALIGKTIRRVSRRAKYINIELNHGSLVVHLRMTGKLTRLFPGKHVTGILHFRSGNALYFQDMRKFGRMEYTEDSKAFFAHLGPEPLNDDFSVSVLQDMLKTKNRMVKPLLLDQTFLAGLGNIYVDEALFRAGIHPESLARYIPKKQTAKLHRAIQQILIESIKAQGTTVVNFSHGENQSGTYQAALQVYGRKDEPCVVCASPIGKIKLGQRGTHFCQTCQKVFRG